MSMAHERSATQGLQDALQALAAARMQTPFAVATGALASLTSTPLFPTELATSPARHPRRWAAFRGGRACARAALAKLGQLGVAIPVGASGAPVWPSGCAGSISHTDDVAAAIVVLCPPESIGLDIENDTPLDDATMLRLVCRPEELLPGREAGDEDNRLRGKLVFVIKEAIYKLCSPLLGVFLDFHDVTVSIDEEACSFEAEIAARAASATRRCAVTGSFTRVDGLFVALALPRAD